MENLKEFFDTSTIHGLSWISTTRRLSKLFWILVVLGGFTGAGYLIYESFDNWHQNPITTTIETLPISKITFPNVTVCPPKNDFLNLNHDVQQSEKVQLNESKREEMVHFALDIIQNAFFKEVMTNLSKLYYPDRYYNWYHGYTKLQYPYCCNYDKQLLLMCKPLLHQETYQHNILVTNLILTKWMVTYLSIYLYFLLAVIQHSCLILRRIH